MRIAVLLAGLTLAGAPGRAQTRNQPGVETQMILTVADHRGHNPVALKAGDVTIVNATITGWRPLAAAQPSAVPIGVAYIHEGVLQIARSPTTDRAGVARALREPSGSKAANPYCALSDLIAQWPKKALRREIILVSTGIDDTTRGAVCVNAETTIRDAERAGVQIFALYNPVANYSAESWSKTDSGVTDLAHVCYETGGEAYFQGHSPMESIDAYLTDIAEHLAHQYLVQFRLTLARDSGFESVYVSSGTSSVELMAPESVWIAPRK